MDLELKKNLETYEPFIQLNFCKNISENEILNASYLDNSFCVFKSIYGVLIIIYSNVNLSIVSYNLNNFQKINEIKKAHNENIINFRHISEIKNKRDLIISCSSPDNNIKLWSFNNWECIYNFKNVNKKNFLYSACFLRNNQDIFIISSNYSYKAISEKMKVFDLNGNKIQEINDSNEKTVFIDTFYDDKLNKHFIVTGNHGYSKSYDYSNNRVYHNYCDNAEKFGIQSSHYNIVINQKEDKIELIESELYVLIRVWNFHTGLLLKKINVIYKPHGICLLNEQYLVTGSFGKFKLIDLKKGIVIQEMKGHKRDIVSIKKINHPQLGECLISHSDKEVITLWTINFNI